MRKELAQIICCPVHKTQMELHVDEEDDHGAIQVGRFHCKECDFDYPIEDGIPNLLPPELHGDEVRS